MKAQELALEQATAASVREYEVRLSEDERMIELAIAASLGKSIVSDVTDPISSEARDVGKAIAGDNTAERPSSAIEGSESQSDEQLQRAVQASLVEAAAARQEEAELAAAIAISQAILDRDPFISSSAFIASSSSSSSSSCVSSCCGSSGGGSLPSAVSSACASGSIADRGIEIIDITNAPMSVVVTQRMGSRGKTDTETALESRGSGGGGCAGRDITDKDKKVEAVAAGGGSGGDW